MKSTLLACLAICVSTTLFADPAATSSSPKMKLYLASGFDEVWDEIVALLPLPPEGSQACHVTTAGFNAEWTRSNTDRIRESGFQARRIDIAEHDGETIEKAFADCDIIYVGGGDEFYLLQEFRRTGFDKVVTQKIAQGVPYIGSSAGSMVLGPSIEFSKSIRDHSASPFLESYDGLNLFPLSLFVHFDNPDLKEVYRKIIDFAWEDGTMFMTMNDNQFVFVDGDHWRIIESKQ